MADPFSAVLGRRGLFGAAAAAATALAAPGAARATSPSITDASRDLARKLLLVGEKDEDLKLAYLRILIDEGLPRTTTPKRVLVVGAGIAGLAAAKLLRDAGHTVTVLEANANRTGGRIKTFRGVFSDPRLHAEAGAMRLPDFHPLALALADRLGLRRRLFYIADVAPGAEPSGPVPPVVYRAFTGEVWTNGKPGEFTAPPYTGRSPILANGIRRTHARYAAAPAELNRTFGSTLTTTTSAAVSKAFARLAGDPRAPIGDQIEGWAKLIRTFDDYSTYRYLVETEGWRLADLEAAETLDCVNWWLHHSVFPTAMDQGIINAGSRYWELEDGTAALTDALTTTLGGAVRRDRRMTALRQTAHGVRIETAAETGGEDDGRGGRPVPVETFEGDYALVTIPLTAQRFCEFTPALSYAKRRAIATVHYDPATKVLLEFGTRFWEHGPDGFTGGGSVSDGPSRLTYFPSHVPDSPGGVVLASYTWSDDALRWDALSEPERYAFALDDLARLFGPVARREFTGVGVTQSWARNRYALGGAAILTPGQLHEYHAATRTAEGRVHFAGEHTSLKSAWIEGSLESAVRAALELHAR
ncbi:flavin monoamine oxidase family protein [Amycolatopsis samaneae]|uniref:Flavin monoamine oxidase family protein n=1 Tax=Amycolatopsis samaneae TaxID=664691 RepID=A0ABW5GVA0_9PSEU